MAFVIKSKRKSQQLQQQKIIEKKFQETTTAAQPSSSNRVSSFSVSTSSSSALSGTEKQDKDKEAITTSPSTHRKKVEVFWQQLTPTGSIAARWGHTCCVVGSKLFVIGGTGNRVYGECYIFDLGKFFKISLLFL